MKRAALVLLASGCGLFPSLDGFSGGDASVDASSEGGAIDAPLDVVVDAPADAPVDANGCDAMTCGSACVDTKTSTTNCGVCGHDCLGAACNGGQCVPTELIKSEDGPYDLAVDNGHLFWTDQGSGEVVTCSVSNCSGSRTVLATFGAPEDLVVDATNVYWTDSSAGNILACARGGCNQSATTLAALQTGIDGIAAWNGVVYWSTSTAIQSCPATGCGGVPKPLVSIYADDLAVVGNAIYAAGDTKVFTCTLPNCTNQVTITSAGAESIASDGTTLFYTATGGVFDCPVTGCTTQASFVAGGAPNDIVTDGKNVYWVDDTLNEALACATSGCSGAATVLGSGLSGPKGVAVDAQRVYFSDTGNGRILWVAK